MKNLHFNCQNETFLAIITKHMDMYNFEHIYFGHEELFFLQWRTKDLQKEHFWKLICKEVLDVHEFFIEEASTPTPFHYVTTDIFYPNQHAIEASFYRQVDTDIRQVLLIGAEEQGKQTITQIILQFEHHFLHIFAGPFVQIKKQDGQFNTTSIHPDLYILFEYN